MTTEKQTRKLDGFDRANVAVIRQEIAAAVAKVASDRGFDVRLGTIRFSADRFTVSVEGTCPNVKAEHGGALATFAGMAGIDPAKTGPAGERLVDYNARAPKNPWIFERDGKRFKCADGYARMLFGAGAEVRQ